MSMVWIFCPLNLTQALPGPWQWPARSATKNEEPLEQVMSNHFEIMLDAALTILFCANRNMECLCKKKPFKTFDIQEEVCMYAQYSLGYVNNAVILVFSCDQRFSSRGNLRCQPL